jgi:hypothetical protein
MGKPLNEILAAVVVGVFVEEAKVMLPWLCQKSLGIAAKLLPSEHRERYTEEWASHLLDVPGPISKLLFTLWLPPAALQIRYFIWRESRRIVRNTQPYLGLYRLALLMLVILAVRCHLRKAMEWLGFSRPRTKILGIDSEVFTAVILAAIVCLCGPQTMQRP